MDSFDGLLPALFSLLSNYVYRAHDGQPAPAPYNLPARSPWLDLIAAQGGGGGGGGPSSSDGADWKLLRGQSSNNNSRIDDPAPPGCLAGGGGGRLYAKLTSKMDHNVLLSSPYLNCALINTKHHPHLHAIDAASDGDFYQALADHP